MQYEKHILIALSLCTFIMLLNVVAVTTGVADPFYTPITEWLKDLHY